MQETLFISDLHLKQSRPDITRCFLQFLEHRATDAEQLYILGDLFDVWVGDDDPSPPNKEVITAIRRLSDSGTQVFFQSGNRDFLINACFAEQCGLTLLGDYHVINLYGTPTLLMHGDLLCSDDIRYQEFRAKSHTAEWRHHVLSKPLLIRLAAAKWYRLRSYFHKQKKTQEIMDVNEVTVKRTLEKYRVTRLIHGHTHRPAVHTLDINGTSGERLVLAMWDKKGCVLCYNRKEQWIEVL